MQAVECNDRRGNCGGSRVSSGGGGAFYSRCGTCGRTGRGRHRHSAVREALGGNAQRRGGSRREGRVCQADERGEAGQVIVIVATAAPAAAASDRASVARLLLCVGRAAAAATTAAAAAASSGCSRCQRQVSRRGGGCAGGGGRGGGWQTIKSPNEPPVGGRRNFCSRSGPRAGAVASGTAAAALTPAVAAAAADIDAHTAAAAATAAARDASARGRIFSRRRLC